MDIYWGIIPVIKLFTGGNFADRDFCSLQSNVEKNAEQNYF